MEISARLFQFTLSNVGELSWGWILSKNVQVKKEKDKLSLYVHVVHKTWN